MFRFIFACSAFCLSYMAQCQGQDVVPTNALRTPQSENQAAVVDAAQDPFRSPSDRPVPETRSQPAPIQEAPAIIAPDSAARALPNTASPTAQPPATAPSPSLNLNDQDTQSPFLDDLEVDDNSQAFQFNDNNSQFTSTQQSSIASNNSFRGASPQMIGDFGGGSTLFTVGGAMGVGLNSLSIPIPFAGGSRRIKIAENNQVLPLNRLYATVNYFHNASQIVGTEDGIEGVVSQVDSDSTTQFAFGFEKTLFDDLVSLDVRMPFTGGVDQFVLNPGSVGFPTPSEIAADSSGVGNLSLTLKAYLIQIDLTSISIGVSTSMPTGSDVRIEATEGVLTDVIEISNDSWHVMPFIGFYRPVADSWWLQGFTQVDIPTNGNALETNGAFRGMLTEQTLLYADLSIGKWLYKRHPCDPMGSRGITSIASILELHYTTSLNDADGFGVSDMTFTSDVGYTGPGFENRFDVLNLTAGLQMDVNDRWRLNVAGAVPLREGRFVDFYGRQEDQFFDGELILQLNRMF